MIWLSTKYEESMGRRSVRRGSFRCEDHPPLRFSELFNSEVPLNKYPLHECRISIAGEWFLIDD